MQEGIGGVVGWVIPGSPFALGICIRRNRKRKSRQTVSPFPNDPRSAAEHKVQNSPSEEVWRIAPFLIGAESPQLSAKTTPIVVTKSPREDVIARDFDTPNPGESSYVLQVLQSYLNLDSL